MPVFSRKHRLIFKKPGGTSRGVLLEKDSWYLLSKESGHINGVGEASLIEGLSPDDPELMQIMIAQYAEQWLHADTATINSHFPAIRFAFEVLRLSQNSRNPFHLFESDFSQGKAGIPINGLIWMDSKKIMFEQIKTKLAEGYRCIKIKIGAIDFNEELELLSYIRQHFGPQEIELRVDANGAFSAENALEKLKRLSQFQLHSIEQPIRQGQWSEMAQLCEKTPVPIALDEELIGISTSLDKAKLIDTINPQFIILKPSLLGGWSSCEEWIELATSKKIGWWATSALESNIGLNAIAQWIASKETSMPQGLGTGGLFTNNVSSPLCIRNGELWYDLDFNWDTDFLEQIG